MTSGHDPNNTKIVLDQSNPTSIATTFIDKYAIDGQYTLRWYVGSFYEWGNGQFSKLDNDTLRSTIRRFLHRAIKLVNPKNSTSAIEVPFHPRKNDIDEVLAALKDTVLILSKFTPAVWLDDNQDNPCPSDLLACRNGMLNLKTNEIMPASPLFFNTSSLPIDYKRDATEPTRWHKFLRDLFGDDKESVQLLQDWFGYCLTSDTRQHKMLLIVGPKRSGKGTIGRVIRELLGPDNVAGPTLASLSMNFGLSALLGKPLAIISDARLSRGRNRTVVVERLLSISGEDAITIDQKYKTLTTVKLPTRIMVLTNEVPELADASCALASRFITLRLTESWLGKENKYLTDELVKELPGILNWAIEGRARLNVRGQFVQPSSASDVVDNLEELGSPIATFIKEECLIGPEHQVETLALFQSWRDWCDNHGHYAGTSSKFGRDLRTVVPNIKKQRPRNGGLQDSRKYVYSGVARKPVTMVPPGPSTNTLLQKKVKNLNINSASARSTRDQDRKASDNG